jgi:hypothetical protein
MDRNTRNIPNGLEAAPAVSMSVFFEGTEITGIRSLDSSWASGYSKGRSALWTDDSGEVSITYLGNGPDSSQWNTLGQLVINGGGMSLSAQAVCDQVSASASANDIVTKKVKFKVFQ